LAKYYLCGCKGVPFHFDPDVLGLADTARRVGQFPSISDSEAVFGVFDRAGSQGNDLEYQGKEKSVSSARGQVNLQAGIPDD